jgi:hypothetical protein
MWSKIWVVKFSLGVEFIINYVVQDLGSKVWSRYPDYNINIESKIWVVKFGLGIRIIILI